MELNTARVFVNDIDAARQHHRVNQPERKSMFARIGQKLITLPCILLVGCAAPPNLPPVLGSILANSGLKPSPPTPSTASAPGPRPRDASQVPVQPKTVATGATPVGQVIMERPPANLDALPRPWKIRPWILSNMEAASTTANNPACFAATPQDAGFPPPFNEAAFIQLWKAQVELLRLEKDPLLVEALGEIVTAYTGVGDLYGSVEVVGLLLSGFEPTGQLRDASRKALTTYNETYYAPQVFINASAKLARRDNLVQSIISYFDALDLAYDEVAKSIMQVKSSRNVLAEVDQISRNAQAMFTACLPRLAALNLALPRSPKKPSNAPASFDDQAIARIAEAEAYMSRHGQSAAALLVHFSGNPKIVAKARTGFHSAIGYVVAREEQSIAKEVSRATFQELVRLDPQLLDAAAKNTSVAYSIANRLPAVRKAMEARKIELRGIVADGSDNRSFQERARVNAPPSIEDVTALVTSLALEDTRRSTGYVLRRESKSSFSFEASGRSSSGITEVSVYGLQCRPEGMAQRCEFSSNLLIKQNRLLGVRTYGLGLSSHNALLQWGKDGLDSSDLRKLGLGWMEPTGRTGSTASSTGREETMADKFMERDIENRQRHSDRQQAERTNRPYDPSRRY